MWIAGVFGAAFVLLVPPFGGFDETVHFLRAWQVSDGGVFATEVDASAGRAGDHDVGGDVPASLLDDMGTLLRAGVFDEGAAGDVFAHLDDRAPRGERVFEGFPSSAVYSPVPYLPSAAAIAVGRALRLSTLALLLAARLASLVVFVALVSRAIRRLPARRRTLAAVAIAPVALFQAATVTADTLTLALTVLVVADALHLAALPPGGVRPGLLVETAVASVALALAKQPYVAAVALLAVGAWRHRGRVAAALAGVGAAAVALAVGWNAWARDRYVAPTFPGEPEGGYAYRGVDADAQLRFVREHPLDFVAAIGRTLGRWGTEIGRDLFAQVQAGRWRAPWPVAVLAAVAVVAVATVDRDAAREDADRAPPATPPAARLLAAALALLTTLAAFLLAYVGWNEVGAPRIDAFQGRYLLPVLALLVVAALPAVGRVSVERGERVVLLAAGCEVAGLVVVAAGLAGRFAL